MSQEQRDSYVIPPNFIEGGSFFGGLFKARNVVEAVILAAGTGLPILTLSLTLTIRIILLCLTSLPLALLALIGIAVIALIGVQRPRSGSPWVPAQERCSSATTAASWSTCRRRAWRCGGARRRASRTPTRASPSPEVR